MSPICAVLTPAGRGAIATIAVAGERAIEVVGRVFQAASAKPLGAYASGSVVFGRLGAAEDAREELVVGLPRANLVEIHCHGGQAAVTAACDALVAAGARLVEAAEFVHGQQADVIQAAALVALGSARTNRTAAILLDQYRGALARALVQIENDLVRGDAISSRRAIERLLEHAELGRRLTAPWRVVLAGPPNAGKSSLMNALVGYERSIVFAEPGTTRDVLSAETAIDGWPVELIDTAGLRDSGDSLEQEGIERARRELARADLVLLVEDVAAAAGSAGAWRSLLRAPGAGLPLVIEVGNKIDLTGRVTPLARQNAWVSARTGEGIKALCHEISRTLVPSPPSPGTAVPFTREQLHALQDVLAKVVARDLAQARSAMAQIIGKRNKSA